MQKCVVICSCFGIALSSAYENSRGVLDQSARRAAGSRRSRSSPSASNSSEFGIVPLGQKCGEMSFSVSWVFGLPPFASALEGQPTMNSSDPLHQARMPDRERRSEPPGHDHQHHGQRRRPESPSQESSFTPAEHMFRFCRAPVMNTSVPCARMNSRNQQTR